MTRNNSTDGELGKCKRGRVLSANTGFTWRRENRGWVGSIQLLPVGKGELPTFLYPISYKVRRFCFHFITQKHNDNTCPLPAKREEDEDEQSL